MIERYSTLEMEKIWSEQHQFDLWLEVEKLAVKYNPEIPQKDIEKILDKVSFTVEKIKSKESETKHELAAFVDVLAESVGPEGRWIHYGLTSSDIIDTALSMQMIEVMQIIIKDLLLFRESLNNTNGYHVMVGRTHGQHAEQITFNHKILVWSSRINRDLNRCKRFIQLEDNLPLGTGRVGKLSGTVGNYSTISPYVAEDALNQELYFATPPSTQVIERDIHAEFVWILASVATTLDSIATDLRILSMSEIGEVAEGFAKGQKGSSAMPHKRNPVRLERVTGLARLSRSFVSTALENSILWNERDISHSSAERIMLPDLSHAVHFILLEMKDIVDNLEIFPQRMKKNLLSTNGVVESHKVMLTLIQSGYSRQEAYRKVQELSFEALNNNQSFFDTCLNSGIFKEEDLLYSFDVVSLPKERGGFF